MEKRRVPYAVDAGDFKRELVSDESTVKTQFYNDNLMCDGSSGSVDAVFGVFRRQ